MGIAKYLIVVPILLVLFFFGTLVYSYVKYKMVKDPINIPTDNDEYRYLNSKLDYFEHGVMSSVFIIIFLLIVIAVPLYMNMYKLPVN